jgi:hypothetical protein
MLYEYTSPWAGFELTMLVVIGTDCTGSCKFSYYAITTTMTPVTGLGLWYYFNATFNIISGMSWQFK